MRRLVAAFKTSTFRRTPNKKLIRVCVQNRSRVILRVLLNRYHPTVKEPLLSSLPLEDRQGILNQEISSKNFSLILQEPFHYIHRIHYSWLKNALAHIPSPFYASMLSVLSQQQASKLSKWFPYRKNAISQPMQNFLLKMIESHLDHPKPIPLEFLPDSPLNQLGSWNKERLIELVEFLGIYDLAAEIRHIIDKERLKKFSPCLSPKHKQFLHMCLHHPEKLSVPPIGLNTWDGNCRTLFSLIHNRGLLRLGKALSGHPPDLVWYITHTLDVGRGHFLTKHYSYQPIQGVTPILMQQVLHLISFLQSPESH